MIPRRNFGIDGSTNSVYGRIISTFSKSETGNFVRHGIYIANQFPTRYESDIPILSFELLPLTQRSARDLTLEAAQSVGSARTVNTRPSNRDLSFLQVKKLLDSRNDKEILEGLRKVINVRFPLS